MVAAVIVVIAFSWIIRIVVTVAVVVASSVATVVMTVVLSTEVLIAASAVLLASDILIATVILLTGRRVIRICLGNVHNHAKRKNCCEAANCNEESLHKMVGKKVANSTNLSAERQ